MTTVLSKVNDLARKVLGAKDAVRDLHNADQGLRQAHAAGEAERATLVSAQAPRPDVFATLEREVDRLGAAGRANLGPRLVQALSGGVDIDASWRVTGLRPGNLAQAFVPQPLTIADLAALCPDVLKAGLRACIQEVIYAAGPSMSQRVQLIAAVDEKIADLEEQHARLVDDAAEAGIPLQHLEANRIRRLQHTQAEERRLRQERDSRSRGDRG